MFEAFQIGPVIIWVRLLFLLIGTWVAIEFFLRLAHTAGLGLQPLREQGGRLLVAFMLGGRLFAILANYQVYLRDPLRIFIVWDGGFSFLGGMIGIGFVLFFLTRTQRATFLQWLDVLLPAASLGLTFDWIGMFAAAQAYGKPTNVPWGVVIETFNVRYSVPIHPVQLYYAVFFFALTFLLLIIRRHSRRAGAETLFGIVLASIVTFLLEFLRGDFSIPVFARPTDFIYLAFLFLSLGILASLERRLTLKGNLLYGGCVILATIVYLVLRNFILADIAWNYFSQPLRFSQVLAVLALLATVVYVVVHRRKYPHL